MPFDCDDDDETKDAIRNCKYLFEPSEYWVDISSEAKDFILACLRVDPQRDLLQVSCFNILFENQLGQANNHDSAASQKIIFKFVSIAKRPNKNILQKAEVCQHQLCRIRVR